jgi:glucose-1-phosphate cytidylyltransferase
MKVAILAGGIGTRLREETEFKPKPMVEIGGRPILWHIMQQYAAYNFTEFVICLGYKGHVIRDYFLNYYMNNCDLTVSLGTNQTQLHNGHSELDWKVTLADTGEKTQTGGRLKRIAKYIDGDRFLATYGDGVSDVDINAVIDSHRRAGKLATVTAVRPSSRFGELLLENGLVKTFYEKPQVSNSWINGGFFVFEKEALDLIESDEDTLERELLIKLAQRNELSVYQHRGFWQCMDTLRESELLNKMWETGNAPWGAGRTAAVAR